MKIVKTILYFIIIQFVLYYVREFKYFWAAIIAFVR